MLMGLSDALDGLLARKYGATSRLGAILDPLADKVLVILAVLLLAWEPSAVPGAKLPNWVVVAVVGKDLWVIIGFVVIYLVTDRFRVLPTYAGKASTVAQVVMITAVLLNPDLNRLAGDARVGDWAMRITTWLVAALCVAAVVSYTRLGLHFVTQHGKPLDNHALPGESPEEAIDADE